MDPSSSWSNAVLIFAVGECPLAMPRSGTYDLSKAIIFVQEYTTAVNALKHSILHKTELFSYSLRVPGSIVR